MKKLTLLALTLFVIHFASAQDSTLHNCSWKMSSLSIRSGMEGYTEYPMSNADMMKIAPSSVLLHRDFSGLNNSPGMNGMLINAMSEFSARIDLNRTSASNRTHVLSPTVHMGFNYGSVQFTGQSYFMNYSHRYDTVTSGNLTLYMDSVHYENYNFEWSTQAASIDIGEDFHSNESRIFSGGFGYGVMLGMGMNSHFYGGHSIMDIITASSPTASAGYYNTVSESDSSEFEFIRTAPSFFARVYFPVYAQFRFSRKDNFFNHLAFIIEGRTGIDLVTLPHLGLQSRPFYAQEVGFKFYFEKSPTKGMYAPVY